MFFERTQDCILGYPQPSLRALKGYFPLTCEARSFQNERVFAACEARTVPSNERVFRSL